MENYTISDLKNLIRALYDGDKDSAVVMKEIAAGMGINLPQKMGLRSYRWIGRARKLAAQYLVECGRISAVVKLRENARRGGYEPIPIQEFLRSVLGEAERLIKGSRNFESCAASVWDNMKTWSANISAYIKQSAAPNNKAGWRCAYYKEDAVYMVCGGGAAFHSVFKITERYFSDAGTVRECINQSEKYLKLCDKMKSPKHKKQP